MESIKDKVAIIGMGCTKFGERWDASAEDLIIEAAYEAYEDAGISPKDIDAAWLATSSSGVTGLTLAAPLQLPNLPITRVENACASGTDALRNAAYAVAAGAYDVVLVLGVEKLKDSGLRGLPADTSPSGGLGTPHPVFGAVHTAPGNFALAATRYFHTYNIGKETIAKISVKNHHNGSMNPRAHFRREITVEEVLKAPMIAWPLGLLDCCPTTDGAAAAIVCRKENARNFNHKDDYVLIKGLGNSCGPGMGRVRRDYDFLHFDENVAAAGQAYRDAGIANPFKELDLAIVHDCFSITELIIYEDLGFCQRGAAKEYIDSGAFEFTGDLPVNTDGGLKSFGHPIGASGLRMAYEVYKQLQGKCGTRQLKSPELGLTHNIGGGPGGGVVCISILGR